MQAEPKANPAPRAPWPLQFASPTDVPWGTLFPQRLIGAVFPVGLIVRLVSAYLLRHPLLQGFLLEIRSLVHHMELRRKRPHDVDGLVFGPYLEQSLDGSYRPCKRTDACMQDTEHFLTRYPWVSTIDAAVFVRAWELGAEWGLGNSCKLADSPQESCVTSPASREGA